MGLPKWLLIFGKSARNVEQPGYGQDMRAIENWAHALQDNMIREIVAGSNVTITDGEGPVVTVAASGGSGGYASLTGPGEGSTPGDLTQAGGFTVNDTQGHGVTVNSNHGNVAVYTNTGYINLDAIGSGNIGFLTSSGTVSATVAGGTVLQCAVGHSFIGAYFNFGSSIYLSDTGSQGITITTSGSPSVGFGFCDINAKKFRVYTGGPNTDEVIGTDNDLHGNAELGFFGATPVTQQSSSGISTVADLVTVLKNYGLLS